MAKIGILVGTRPNFVKITQFRKELNHYPQHSLRIIHSNQHYTESVSSVFFEQFGLSVDTILPAFNGHPASHLGHIIFHLSEDLIKDPVNLLIVVGDVNTTLGGAIVANKMGIKLAHLESGLRSYDRDMPEEINRILTDEITDHYFVTEQSGYDNLIRENRSKDRIHFVGNTMIDTLVAFKNEIQQAETTVDTSGEYLLLTLHRPSNVDTEEGILKTLKLLSRLTERNKVIFPIHPRTEKKFREFGYYDTLVSLEGLELCEPLDYFTFQKLISGAKAVITDSGGIQEETTFLQIPCITLRENTERPVTIDLGTNILMEFDPDAILDRLENANTEGSIVPPLWDGKATQRVVQVLDQILSEG